MPKEDSKSKLLITPNWGTPSWGPDIRKRSQDFSIQPCLNSYHKGFLYATESRNGLLCSKHNWLNFLSLVSFYDYEEASYVSKPILQS
jgi:hypothetical protein